MKVSAKTITFIFSMWHLLSANATFAYTHADTLRGSNGRGRSWWDVQKYDLSVQFDTANKSISGRVQIFAKIAGPIADSMQIDLQEPMTIDSILLSPSARSSKQVKLSFTREENVWWVKYPFHALEDSLISVVFYYHGTPRRAVNPPWDGGFTWKTDKRGRPWISVSCQELGASVWWPCKDAQWDEPERGMNIRLTVPGALRAVSNGRLLASTENEGMTTWNWQVQNPINNYDATFYIGDYVHWQDTIMGEKGKLDLDFWALRFNEEKARKHFEHVKQMLHCFEYWLGPYPFYEDGYKLVEAPYLGMEHQSAVAYGNQYRMGYLGHDRTGTGIGMNFDYITVHESAHEWYGNNITAKDIADMWVQEGITTYSESLYAECLLGKEKGQEYCRGEWRNVRNDRPIIGDYGVNNEGSGDMYDKGAAIMHMIRVMTDNDEKFRQTLRGLNSTFYHKTVTTAEIENYIAGHTGLKLAAFFDQYLRTTKIPELEYYVKDKELYYRFNNVVAGFSLPIPVNCEPAMTIRPTDKWQHVKWKGGMNVEFSKDFLITVK
jgi:aminopeptidase N